MADRSIHAVSPTPESLTVIIAPRDKHRARALRKAATASGTGFYCALAVGGCGAELELTAGEMIGPYFRHTKGNSCTLSEAAARDRYTHLAMQHALQGWIHETTPLQCRLEVATEDRRGRNDLIITDGITALGVEIQRSPLTAAERARRTSTYLGSVQAVQWLYEDDGIQACRGEAEATGFALRVRMKDDGACEIGYFGPHARGGIVQLETTWLPLAEWHVTRAGIRSHAITAVREAAQAAARKPKEDTENRVNPASSGRGGLWAGGYPAAMREAAAAIGRESIEKLREMERQRHHIGPEDGPTPCPLCAVFPAGHPAYECRYARLRQAYGVLPEWARPARERILDAVYRRTRKGQIEQVDALAVLGWLDEHSAYRWWVGLLGSRSKDGEIAQRVVEAYFGR